MIETLKKYRKLNEAVNTIDMYINYEKHTEFLDKPTKDEVDAALKCIKGYIDGLYGDMESVWLGIGI